MKYLLLFVLLFMVGTMELKAQQDSARFRNRNVSAEEMAQRQDKWMQDSLNLTAEQLPKVSALNLEYSQKLKKVMDSEMERMEKFQEFQVLQQNKDYEIKKVLNKEQFKKYQKIQEAMRQRMRERRQGQN
jgi:Spy/CpxP family protein refolding chaperone